LPRAHKTRAARAERILAAEERPYGPLTTLGIPATLPLPPEESNPRCGCRCTGDQLGWPAGFVTFL